MSFTITKTQPVMWLDNILVHRWLPEGQIGRWRISRNIVHGDRWEWLSKHDPRCGISPPAIYTELYYNDNRWMNDSVWEILTTEHFIDLAHGDILISGLGMGMVPAWLAQKESVKSIHIIEVNSEVIDLVATHLIKLSDKIYITQFNTFDYIPTRQYDFAWHDIWQANKDQNDIDKLLKHYNPYIITNQYFWDETISSIN